MRTRRENVNDRFRYHRMPLPLPPQGLTPDSDLLRHIWLRAPQPRTAMHRIGLYFYEALESRGDPATTHETSHSRFLALCLFESACTA